MTDLTPVPTGSDIQANTFTVGAERYSSVAALEDGGFIVTWQRTNTSSTSIIEGIYGQRYDAMGAPVGGQLFIASGIFSIQAYPVVAPLSDGGFVVVRQSYPDGSFWGIYGQRFDASGAAVGGEFRANTYTADNQVAPSVAALEDGGFVVTWSSNGQDGSGYGIYGQRYDATGAAAGGEFQVNATTVDHQAFSAVAGLEGGGFVVTWQSFNQDGSGWGIYGQRYDAAGVAFGTEFLVNTTTGGEQDNASVTALADGGFVITWSSDGQDGSSYGIYGQRYNAAGVAVGTEFQVNTETADEQNFSSVTALADGGFVVTWSSNGQDGSGWGIYGQRFAADGSALGTEFRLNDITTGDQVNESFDGQQWLATLADGRLVATWTGLGPEEVFVRLVDVPTVTTPSGVTTPVDVNAAANAIDENTTGAVGITAHATDLDATDTVTYALVTDASGATPYTGPFAIDSQTGVISLTSPLDYETDGATQTLFVQATSSDGSSAVETFTVAIGDVNETGVTTPVDVDAAANAIDENTTGAVGITAQATDPDVTDTVTYALVTDASGAAPYTGPFAIDSQTGVISLTSPLDYETNGATQTLFVQATSSDGSSTVETFTVAINNVNEDPTAIAISNDMIAENSAPGTIVGTLSATDPDAGETFSYQLLDDAGGLFALDGNLLEVAGDLDFETATSHQVTVRVTDSGGLSHDETFTIGVTDAVENPPSIINRDNVSDDTTLNLNAAASAASAEVGGTTYLFVTGFLDNGVSVFAVGADGALTNVENVTDEATLNLQGAVSVATAEVGGTTYLFVAGLEDSGVSAFAVGADGSLVHVDDVNDDATLNLGVAADVATAVVGGTTYLFVAGADDSGVSVFAVGNDGALTNVANVTDDATLNLHGAVSVATAEVGGTTYLFVAGLEDNGVSVFAVGNDGALTNVDNVVDDTALQLAGAISVTTAVVGGTAYLFVAGVVDNGVSVFAIGNDGALTNVANVTDDATLNLDGANGVATAVIGGATYLFVAAYYEGLSVFAVGNDGALTYVANVADDATLNLLGTSSVTTAVANGTAYLFATGDQDNGVSVFELTSDDTLSGVTTPVDIDAAANAIDENTTGTVGITAQATDPDATDTVTFALVTDLSGATPYTGPFAIDSQTGVISLTAALDRETDGATQTLFVQATSSDGSSAVETFTVAIGDVNEGVTTPVDVDAAANAIDENATGTVGITAQATDPDATDTVTFALVTDLSGATPYTGPFAIDSQTGVISLTAALDRETDGATQTLFVQAISSDGSSAVESFTVAIGDVNETGVTTPVDVDVAANAINENTTGTVGITAQATDADATDTVTYALVTDASGATPYTGPFAIDSQTGVISLTSALDYETDGATQTLFVQATSSDGSSAVETFTVATGDVNDAPVNAVPGTQEIETNTATAIAGLSIDDPDAGGGSLTTTLTVAHGTLTLAALGGGASGEGGLPGAGGAGGAGSEGDEGDEGGLLGAGGAGGAGGVLDAGGASVSGSGTGTVTISGTVAQINAALGANNVVYRSATDFVGADTLTIATNDNGNTGSGGPLTDSDQIAINVISAVDDGDEAGVTTPVDVDAAANAIDENTTGTVGITAQASDADATDTVTYALVTDASGATPYAGLFAIDSQTGVISLTSPLDYETDDATQTLFVQATSSDGSSAVETFTVAIGDVNEEPTAIALSNDTIAENSAPGTIVGTLSAIDPDAGDTFSYQLLDDAGGLFALDGSNLVVAGPLNFESAGSHGVTVRVFDSSDNSHDEDFTIAIGDVNEDPTAIAISNDMIAENSAPGTIVGTLSATDPDAGETFSYQLLDDAGGRFALDGSNLVVAGALDFESATSHQVSVRVTDAGGLSYDESFTIAVTDVAGLNLVGDGGSNTLNGSPEDDVLTGLAGDDTLDGRAGVDTAVYSGARADYAVTDLGGDRFRIADLRSGSPDGTDSVSNVEFFQFADGVLAGDDLINFAPVVTASDISAARGQVFNASDLFTAFDADNDTLTYGLHDLSAGPTSGFFTVNGVVQPANATFVLTAAQLAQTTFTAGSMSSDALLVNISDGLDFSEVREFHVNVPPNHAPTVTAPDISAARGQVFNASDLFTAFDADNDTLTYGLHDQSAHPTSGFFTVNGVVQPANATFVLTAAQLAQTTFTAGSLSSDNLLVNISDGLGFSEVKEFHVNVPPNHAPTVTAPDISATRGQVFNASDLFTAFDADNDTLTYGLHDQSAHPTSGFFTVNGVVQPANATFVLTAAQLAQTTFTADSLSSDNLLVNISDGLGFSEVKEFHVNVPPNHAPTVTAPDISATRGQVFNASDLFTAFDADNDTLTFGLHDQSAHPTSGFFTVNGVVQPANATFVLTAAQLAQTTFTAGSLSSDNLLVNISDGLGFSEVKEFHVNVPPNHAPTVTAPDISATRGQVFNASDLFTAFDADNDTLTFGLHDQSAHPTSGFFTVNGVVQPANATFVLTAAQLAQTTFTAGSLSSDNLLVNISDGLGFSEVKEFHVNVPPNHAPTVTAPDISATRGQVFNASDLFTAFDADNDTLTFGLHDQSAHPTSGFFTVNGVVQPANATFVLTAAQLAQTTFTAGSLSSDNLLVNISDGLGFSEVKEFHVNVPPNHAPTVTAPDISASPGQVLTAASLFSASDADGDPLLYFFFDNSADPASGHFEIDGMAQAANTTFAVGAAQLAQTTFVAGTVADELYVNVWDGAAYSGPQEFHIL